MSAPRLATPRRPAATNSTGSSAALTDHRVHLRLSFDVSGPAKDD